MSADVAFRTDIAAVNAVSTGDKHRVYFLDTAGRVREASHDGNWSGGTQADVVGRTKRDSPLAATATKNLNDINIFFLDDVDDEIRGRVYTASSGSWAPSSIRTSFVATAPYSRLGAVWLNTEDELRVFYQKKDDTIQEMKWPKASGQWQTGDNLGKALAGTSIGVTAFDENGTKAIRLYIQEDTGNIVQKCWNDGRGWWSMDYVVGQNAPFRTAITVTNFDYGSTGKKVNLRVYWAGSDNKLWQWCWNQDGWRNTRGLNGQVLAPGTQLAAFSWGNNPDLRVYYQPNNPVAGITEWVYRGGSPGDGETGKNPLPPL